VDENEETPLNIIKGQEAVDFSNKAEDSKAVEDLSQDVEDLSQSDADKKVPSIFEKSLNFNDEKELSILKE
jgi:hypothetical protein